MGDSDVIAKARDLNNSNADVHSEWRSGCPVAFLTVAPQTLERPSRPNTPALASSMFVKRLDRTDCHLSPSQTAPEEQREVHEPRGHAKPDLRSPAAAPLPLFVQATLIPDLLDAASDFSNRVPFTCATNCADAPASLSPSFRRGLKAITAITDRDVVATVETRTARLREPHPSAHPSRFVTRAGTTTITTSLTILKATPA